MKKKHETTDLEVVGILAIWVAALLGFCGLIFTIHYVKEAHTQSSEALDQIFRSDIQRQYDMKVIARSLEILCNHDKRCSWDESAAELLK